MFFKSLEIQHCIRLQCVVKNISSNVGHCRKKVYFFLFVGLHGFFSSNTILIQFLFFYFQRDMKNNIRDRNFLTKVLRKKRSDKFRPLFFY